jgi:hypothetical protein
MIIVHASLHKGELLLWGETPPNQTADQTTRRGRGRRIAKPGPYPYGAGIDNLTRSLKEAGIAAEVRAEQVRESGRMASHERGHAGSVESTHCTAASLSFKGNT